MAYDEALAARVRDALGARSGVSEKKMFGGLCFLLHGNMCVGIVKDELMVRTGAEGYEALLVRPHVREMDFTKRPMRGFLYVDREGLKSEAELSEWVGIGADYAASLPKKTAQPAKASKKR